MCTRTVSFETQQHESTTDEQENVDALQAQWFHGVSQRLHSERHRLATTDKTDKRRYHAMNNSSCTQSGSCVPPNQTLLNLLDDAWKELFRMEESCRIGIEAAQLNWRNHRIEAVSIQVKQNTIERSVLDQQMEQQREVSVRALEGLGVEELSCRSIISDGEVHWRTRMMTPHLQDTVHVLSSIHGECRLYNRSRRKSELTRIVQREEEFHRRSILLADEAMRREVQDRFISAASQWFIRTRDVFAQTSRVKALSRLMEAEEETIRRRAGESEINHRSHLHELLSAALRQEGVLLSRVVASITTNNVPFPMFVLQEQEGNNRCEVVRCEHQWHMEQLEVQHQLCRRLQAFCAHQRLKEYEKQREDAGKLLDECRYEESGKRQRIGSAYQNWVDQFMLEVNSSSTNDRHERCVASFADHAAHIKLDVLLKDEKHIRLEVEQRVDLWYQHFHTHQRLERAFPPPPRDAVSSVHSTSLRNQEANAAALFTLERQIREGIEGSRTLWFDHWKNVEDQKVSAANVTGDVARNDLTQREGCQRGYVECAEERWRDHVLTMKTAVLQRTQMNSQVKKRLVVLDTKKK